MDNISKVKSFARLVCHCCLVTRPDTHNIDVHQKESSILFLGYQKAILFLSVNVIFEK